MAPRRTLNKHVVMSIQRSSMDFVFQPLHSPTLNLDDSNFLKWINDARRVLNVEDLANTLTVEIATNLYFVCK